MTLPQLSIVLEFEHSGVGVWLSSFDFADELRLSEYLDARDRAQLEREVLAALEVGLQVLRRRAEKAVAADVYRRSTDRRRAA